MTLPKPLFSNRGVDGWFPSRCMLSGSDKEPQGARRSRRRQRAWVEAGNPETTRLETANAEALPNTASGSERLERVEARETLEEAEEDVGAADARSGLDIAVALAHAQHLARELYSASWARASIIQAQTEAYEAIMADQVGRGQCELLTSASTASSASGPQNSRSLSFDCPEHHRTLRECFVEVQSYDPSNVVIVRGIGRLGFESHHVLRQHFSKYDEIQNVLIAHSRVKNRMRPGNMGFIIAGSADGVQRILTDGSIHAIGDVQMHVERYKPPTRLDATADGNGHANGLEAGSTTLLEETAQLADSVASSVFRLEADEPQRVEGTFSPEVWAPSGSIGREVMMARITEEGNHTFGGTSSTIDPAGILEQAGAPWAQASAGAPLPASDATDFFESQVDELDKWFQENLINHTISHPVVLCSQLAVVLHKLSRLAREYESVSSVTQQQSIWILTLVQWAKQSLHQLELECTSKILRQHSASVL